MYLNRGHDLPESLNICRVDFGHVTACLIRRVTTCRGHRGACLGLPNSTFWQKLSSLKWYQITQNVGIRWLR